MKILATLALPLLLSACVTYHTHDDGITRARMGEAVTLASHQVIPLKLLEDSRCPQKVECIRAGDVRVLVRLDNTIPEDTRTVTLGVPVSLERGQLTLVEVYPERRKDMAIYPEEYRFGFQFAPATTAAAGGIGK